MHYTKEEGLRLIKAGDYKAAVEVLDHILDADPTDALAFLYMGVAYAETGNRGEAIASFEQSVSLASTTRGHYNLGVAYEMAERLGEAMTQYEYALRLDPEYKQAHAAVERLRQQGIEAKESTVQWTIGAQSIGDAMAKPKQEEAPPVVEQPEEAAQQAG